MHAPSANTVRPTTLILILLAAAYSVAYRFIPYDIQAFFLWPLCALGLFSGARLRVGMAVAISLGVQFTTDALFYVSKQWDPAAYIYPCLVLNVVLGRYVLRTSASTGRILGSSVVSFVVFFLVSNIGSWWQNALPEYQPHTFQTMLYALQQGLEFALRKQPGQLLGTPVCALLLFGADMALARATSNATERAMR